MKINKVTIHITASDGTVESIRKIHIAQGWSDIGYHWVVDKQGEVFKGRPEHLTGAHVGGHNTGNIGISYISRGNDIESNAPYGKYMTVEQARALENKVADILYRYNLTIDNIYGHNDFEGVAKACPCFKVRRAVVFLQNVDKELRRLKAGGGGIKSAPEQAIAVDGENAEATEEPEKAIRNGGTMDLQLIREFEGLRLKAYQDSVGVWTIGYGTTRINGEPVKQGMEITKEKAEELLLEDVTAFANKIKPLITASVTTNQFNALVSLAYNIGVGAFGKSTLLKKLNSGDIFSAADQFLVWNKAGGKVLQGLVNRRKKERELFLTP